MKWLGLDIGRSMNRLSVIVGSGEVNQPISQSINRTRSLKPVSQSVDYLGTQMAYRCALPRERRFSKQLPKVVTNLQESKRTVVPMA